MHLDQSRFSAVIPRLPEIAFGGDWNPEQWPEHVWEEDIRLMKEAGVNLVTPAVFSWAMIQPTEEYWNFDWLDKILSLCLDAGIKVDMATATASPPPWLGLKYPDTLAVTADGMQLAWGARQHYSPSSKTFKDKSQMVVRKLLERYGDHEAIVMWHVGNEYGAHTAYCYSTESEVAFRKWLQNKYQSIEKLNERWGTRFWSQQYSEWKEVMPPRTTAYFPNPSQQLDFKRFSSDAMLALYKGEYELIRSTVAADIPVTTNFMRLFPHADYWRWAKEIDVISDDWYPDQSDADNQIEGALGADLMRSLKDGKPWILMEQATSAINWRAVNPPKVDGSYSRWSIQQVAHGADGVLHFQWRASIRGAEKWHSGMLPHAGTNTRIWREVTELGSNLKKLQPVVGSRTRADVALLLDWNSWWSLELDSRPSTLLSQRKILLDYYRHFLEQGYSVDIAHPEQDLSNYKLVVAPNLYLVTDLALVNIRKAIESGVNFVLGAFSVAVDEDEGVRPGGHLMGLRDLFGAYSEEWSPIYPGQQLDLAGIKGKKVGTASGWSEFMKVQNGAEIILKYASGSLKSMPALVRKRFDKNSTWIFSCLPNTQLMSKLIAEIAKESKLERLFSKSNKGIEVTKRENDQDSFFFLLNHGNSSGSVNLNVVTTDLISGQQFNVKNPIQVVAGGWRVVRSVK